MAARVSTTVAFILSASTNQSGHRRRGFKKTTCRCRGRHSDYLGTVPCGATLIRCFSVTVFNLDGWQRMAKMELVCRHLETVSFNEKKLVRNHSWTKSHREHFEMKCGPNFIPNPKSPVEKSNLCTNSCYNSSHRQKMQSVQLMSSISVFLVPNKKCEAPHRIQTEMHLDSQWDWRSSSCLVDSWSTFTEVFGVLDR